MTESSAEILEKDIAADSPEFATTFVYKVVEGPCEVNHYGEILNRTQTHSQGLNWPSWHRCLLK